MDFQIGDFLIDYGQVFKIIAIKTIKLDTCSDKLLTFTPYFQTKNEPEVSSSIPQKNLEKTTIRKPLSKLDMQKVLDILSDKSIKKEDIIIDVLTAKAVLNSNDPYQISQTIRKIYLEKISQEAKFTGSKNYIYELLIERLSEETAIVFNLDKDKASKKIENCLTKK